MADITRYFLLYAKVALPATVLIVVLLSLTPLLRRVYAAKWRYWVWLLLMLRLLIPFSPQMSVAPVSIPVSVIDFPTQSRAPEQPPDPVTLPDTAGPIAETAPVFTPSPLEIVAWVWAGGALLLLAFHLCNYVRFWRLWNRRTPLTAPSEALQAIWRQAGEEMNIRRLPELYISRAVSAPVLTGLLRPALLLPHEDFSSAHRHLIFRHELEHYRRHDLWYLSGLLLARCIHWYNPAVHRMGARAVQDLELSCDDAVSAGMDQKARGEYGAAILSALPEKGKVTPLFTTSFASAKGQVKGRLRNLFDQRAKRRGRIALSAVAALSVVAGSLVAWMPVSAANAPADTSATPPPASAAKSAILADTVSIAIDRLPAGQARCVGKMTLDGSPIVYDVTAQSGTSFFVAFGETDSITDIATAKWRNSISNGQNGPAIQTSFRNSMVTGAYYVYVVNEGPTALVGVTGSVYQKRETTPDLSTQLTAFAPYGITWDAGNERLYHNGQRVGLFVSFRDDGSFHVCWQDEDGDSGLYLEGLLDAAGNPVGVKALRPEIAADLLDNLAGGYAVSPPSSKRQGVVAYTMDATSIYGDNEIVATDKDMLIANVPENIQRWISRCDQATGAFLLQQIKPEGRHTFYLYYNGGGRYPWDYTINEDTVTFNLYSQSTMATNDGYHLMRIDADGAWRIGASLDGAPLPFRTA